jgi:hypothetical protein
MPHKRYAAKVDNNQPALVGELRAMGFSVLLLHRVGSGCPDILAGRAGRNLLIEIKNGRGALTGDERDFIADWQGSVIVAKTAEEVLSWFEESL